MALAAAGLQTHIWNNQIKSVLLLLGFPVLLLLMIGVFFALISADASGVDPVDAGMQGVMRYGHWAVMAAALWFLIAWFTHTAIINAATGAKPVTRQEMPEVYNLLENLCISRGMAMPQLQIMESPVLNAFASGIDDKSYRITLTRGIVEALDEEALEAVIAHELSHIRHKDVRLLIVAVIFAGIISFSCEMIYRLAMYGGGRRRDVRMLIVGFVLLGVGYMLAIALRFALSRKREYLADAGAVELTHNPDAMIRALRRISGKAEMPSVPDDIRQMMIENATGFFGMFATHPPIESRIKALVMLGGRDTGSLVPHEPEATSAPAPEAQAKRLPWQRRHGPWN